MSTTAGEAAALSLRERKKSATRAALRRSAVALVASRGLCAVTVEDIAAAAGVSPRTFFNYFSSKVDAISGFDPAVLAEIADRLRSRPASQAPAEALRAAMLDVLPGFEVDRRDLLERMAVVRSNPHLLAWHVSGWAEIERQLVAVLAERRGRRPGDDRYASLVVAATLAAGRVALMSWCEQKGRGSLAEELAFHYDVLGAGLAEPDHPIERAHHDQEHHVSRSHR